MTRGLIFGLAAALAAAGCGGGKPTAIPVTGTVTINGKPAANILVQFHPEKSAGSKPYSSSGVTDAAGKYALTCETGDPGAVPGPHKVMLIDKNLETDEEPDGKPKAGKPAVNRVPPQYGSTATSQQSFTVEPGKTDYDIKITTNVPDR